MHSNMPNAVCNDADSVPAPTTEASDNPMAAPSGQNAPVLAPSGQNAPTDFGNVMELLGPVPGETSPRPTADLGTEIHIPAGTAIVVQVGEETFRSNSTDPLERQLVLSFILLVALQHL